MSDGPEGDFGASGAAGFGGLYGFGAGAGAGWEGFASTEIELLDGLCGLYSVASPYQVVVYVEQPQVVAFGCNSAGISYLGAASLWVGGWYCAGESYLGGCSALFLR